MQMPGDSRFMNGARRRSRLGSVLVTFAAAALCCVFLAPQRALAGRFQDKPAASQPAAKAGAAKQSETSSSEELRKLIEKRLQEKRSAASRSGIATPQRAGVRSAPRVQPGAATTRPATRSNVATSSGCGPGATQLDFNPPPADQPQPAYTCDKEAVNCGAVWKGKPADFTFSIRNSGKGVLNVQLKGH